MVLIFAILCLIGAMAGATSSTATIESSNSENAISADVVPEGNVVAPGLPSCLRETSGYRDLSLPYARHAAILPEAFCNHE